MKPITLSAFDPLAVRTHTAGTRRDHEFVDESFGRVQNLNCGRITE